MPPPDDDPNGPAPLDPRDAAVLDAFARGNEWTRAVSCTLARRGGALRRDQPERAARILDALRPSPLFKGGQFLFDLMEWEDFMLDGPAPPVVDTALDARSLARLAELLESVRGHLDGAATVGSEGLPIDVDPAPRDEPVEEELPELEPGLYLYEDVVLGAVRSAGWQLE